MCDCGTASLELEVVRVLPEWGEGRERRLESKAGRACGKRMRARNVALKPGAGVAKAVVKPGSRWACRAVADGGLRGYCYGKKNER